MTIYVDDTLQLAMIGDVESRWSRMLADSRDELHAFAARLGVPRDRFGDPVHAMGRGHFVRAGSRYAEDWSYLVTEMQRLDAIRLGAKEVAREDVEWIVDRRYEKIKGLPPEFRRCHGCDSPQCWGTCGMTINPVTVYLR